MKAGNFWLGLAFFNGRKSMGPMYRAKSANWLVNSHWWAIRNLQCCWRWPSTLRNFVRGIAVMFRASRKSWRFAHSNGPGDSRFTSIRSLMSTPYTVCLACMLWRPTLILNANATSIRSFCSKTDAAHCQLRTAYAYYPVSRTRISIANARGWIRIKWTILSLSMCTNIA